MFENATYTWIVAGVLVVFFFIKWYLGRNDDYWQKRGVPFTPRISFFALMFKLAFSDITGFLKDMVNKPFGKVYGSFEGSLPTVVVAEPDLLREILVKDFHVFPYRRSFLTGDPVADNMVSLISGEDWKRIRTIITPAFTSKRMRQMSSIIDECSKSVVEVCEEHCEKGKPVDFKSLFGSFIMDVIAKSAFGTQINSHKDPKNEFVRKARESFLNHTIPRMMFFFLLPRWIMKCLPSNFNVLKYDKDNFFREVTMSIIRKRKETGVRYNDFLQLLMDAADENSRTVQVDAVEDETDQFGSIMGDNGLATSGKYKGLSEDELLAQCILFFMVGYEKTASVLPSLAHCLAVHKEWQEKLINEVDEAFQKHKEMYYDALRDMKILDAVLSETLRMHPPVASTERTCVEDYELANTGIKVEKGMRIVIPVYGMHYHPDFFQDPNTFNPERFMDSYEPKHHPYAYLPFGAGPRNCLGMRFALLEIKVCISNLLRRFRLKPHSTTKIPLQYKRGKIVLSVGELPLLLERRTDAK